MKRLEAYHTMTAPISSYYLKQGILHNIDASKPAEEVWTQIVSALQQSE